MRTQETVASPSGRVKDMYLRIRYNILQASIAEISTHSEVDSLIRDGSQKLSRVQLRFICKFTLIQTMYDL